MKKSFILMLVLLLAFLMVFSGCSAETPSENEETETESTENDASEGEEHVIKFADSQPETTGIVMYIKRFGEILEEKTDGRIKVEIYPNAMMGSGGECMQQVQMGSLDMYRSDASVVYDFGVDSMKIPGLPYLFNDKKHAEKVLHGEIGKQFSQDITDADVGFVGIGWLVDSGRSIFTNDVRVTKLEDVKGLKLRSLEASVFMDSKEALGMNPTPLAFSEVYTGLSTGVIDGATNTLDSFVNNKMYEVAKYFVKSEMIYNPCPVVFSAKNWEKYSAEDQQLIIDSWAEAMVEHDVYAAELEDKLTEEAEEHGYEVTELEDRDKWVEAVQPVIEKYSEGYEELVDEIKAMK
jgi:tripartite ATP-independent transporter DctP family solute receptor